LLGCEIGYVHGEHYGLFSRYYTHRLASVANKPYRSV